MRGYLLERVPLGSQMPYGEEAQDRWRDCGCVFRPGVQSGESDLLLVAESSSPLQTPSRLQTYEQFVIILSFKLWAALLHSSWYLNTANVSWLKSTS